MRLVRSALVALLLVLSAQAAWAAGEAAPPTPTQWVSDNAGLLSPATRDTLNQRLAAYSRETGHQVLVWIGTTTGDTPLEDWTINAFTAWKVGRKGIDDGLVLFLFSQDRKIRIEVGYGLEGVMTDAISSRIIRNDIAPLMQQGNPDAAVTAGVNAILQTIGGENGASPQPEQNGSATSNSNDFWIGLVIFFVLFAIFLSFTRAARRYYTIGSGPYMGTWGGGGFGGGWGGDGGSGGGGFSGGGGGGGGGGGASGGW